MSILDFSSSNRPAVPIKMAIFGTILVGAMLIPGTTMAQDPVGPVPLTVMRRALEAFDDAPFTTGYVVLEAEFPHTVRRVVPSIDSANAFISAAPQGTLTVAGPLSHVIRSAEYIICDHVRYTSEIECPGGEPFDTSRVMVPSIPSDSVGSIELVVTMINGDLHRLPIHPDKDAIFLGASAMAKFVWPYFAAHWGVEYAAQRRREYLGIP